MPGPSVMAGAVWRIRDRRSFRALRVDGSRSRSGPLAVTILPDASLTGAPRVAFAIGRNVGPAVVRNRVRRRLRAQFRALRQPSGAYLISVEPAGAALTSRQLGEHLATAVGRT